MLTRHSATPVFKTIKIKTYVKILEIHFTYDYRVKQKDMEIERPHYYWQDSNCQDIHYPNVPLSSKHDLFKQRICERGQ